SDKQNRPHFCGWVHPRYPFFLPVKVLSHVFRGKFIAGLKRAFSQEQLLFPDSLNHWQRQKRSIPFCGLSFARTGWFTPNHPSEDRNTFSSIWPRWAGTDRIAQASSGRSLPICVRT